MKYIKFTTVMDVGIDEVKAKEINTWNVELTDYVNSVTADHLRDKGLIIKCTTFEADTYKETIEFVEDAIRSKVVSELEAEIISHSCVNGVCED
jgi:CO dehydrogenase/acetyl-CoA synthase gamma subunit (corrinoid Fe-S protein)